MSRKRPRLTNPEEQDEEDRIRWVRLCRTAPSKAIQILQQSDAPRNPCCKNLFRKANVLRITEAVPRLRVEHADSFHDAVYQLLAMDSPSQRFERWHKRHLTKEWPDILIAKHRNALKVNILELNLFTCLWIRLSIPNFFVVERGRCSAVSSPSHTFLCKAKLDVVSHWRESSTVYGYRRKRNRVRVIFVTPILVPFIRSLPSIRETSKRPKWASVSDRSYVDLPDRFNRQVIHRDTMDLQYAEITHAWCYLKRQQWRGCIHRGQRGQEQIPRYLITGEVGAEVMMDETKRFDLLQRNNPIDILAPLWELICDYEMGA